VGIRKEEDICREKKKKGRNKEYCPLQKYHNVVETGVNVDTD